MPDATPPPRKFGPPVVPPPSITIKSRDKIPPRGGLVTPPKPAVVFKCGCRKTAVECGAMECPKHDRILRASKPRKRKPQPVVDLDFGGAEPGRLPVGTSKTITWDGISHLGRMTVPGFPEPFVASAPTEKRCWHALHDAYIARYRNTSQPG